MLRLRIIITTLVSIVILITLLYSVSTQVLSNSYAQIEETQMLRNLERVDYAISNYGNSLNIKLRDWAQWDDTYNFVAATDPEYIETNLDDSTLINLEINLVVFVDKDGKAIYSKYIDLNEEIELPSEELVQHIIQSDLYKGPDTGASGVLSVEDGLLLLEGLPVVLSDGSGPANGTVYFGKFIDDTFISGIEELTRLDIGITPTDSHRSTEGAYKIRTDAANNITGWFTLLGPIEQPLADIEVTYPRTIYQQGQKTIVTYTVIASLSIFIFGIIILVLFETLLLQRLLRLSHEVDGISVNNLENERITEHRDDELGKVGQTINHLLDELAKAQKKEREATHLEMIANEKLKKSLKSTENMNKLMIGRELKMVELKEKLNKLEQKSERDI